MIQVYMDDSGSHDGSHNCVVGGYWGSVDAWAKLELFWEQLIYVHEIKEFKATKFWARKSPPTSKPNPFASWSDSKCSNFIDVLLASIMGTEIFPFACGVLEDEWSKQPLRTKLVICQSPMAAYQKSLFLSLTRCLYKVADYCPKGETIHFVFDQNTDRD